MGSVLRLLCHQRPQRYPCTDGQVQMRNINVHKSALTVIFHRHRWPNARLYGNSETDTREEQKTSFWPSNQRLIYMPWRTAAITLSDLSMHKGFSR